MSPYGLFHAIGSSHSIPCQESRGNSGSCSTIRMRIELARHIFRHNQVIARSRLREYFRNIEYSINSGNNMTSYSLIHIPPDKLLRVGQTVWGHGAKDDRHIDTAVFKDGHNGLQILQQLRGASSGRTYIVDPQCYDNLIALLGFAQPSLVACGIVSSRPPRSEIPYPVFRAKPLRNAGNPGPDAFARLG